MWPQRDDPKGALRTVVMPTDPGRATFTLRWPEGKAPGDQLPFWFDLGSWLGKTLDTIASFTVGVVPNGAGDVTVAAQGFVAATGTSITLAGGNVGTDYAVTFTIALASGGVLVRTVWLACHYLSPEGLASPIESNAAIPAVLPPLTLVDGVVTLDPAEFDAYQLARLNSYPNITVPGTGWRNNNGIAQYVYP